MRRVLAFLLLMGFGAFAFAQADDVVASFNGVELRASELRRLLAGQPPLAREQIAASPAALDRIVRTEMFRRALAAEARAKGWDKRPEAIERMELAREQALVSSYVDSLARPGGEYPSDKELREAYEGNRAEFTIPKQYRVAQIYVTARDKADDLARRARAAGADFAALARAGSEHAESAARGGEIGWLGEGQALPEVTKALAGAKPGDVVGPIASATGFHIVKLLEAREPRVRSFDEVKSELATALRLRRAQENEQRHYDEMLKRSDLAVNEVALQKLKNELAKAR